VVHTCSEQLTGTVYNCTCQRNEIIHTKQNKTKEREVLCSESRPRKAVLMLVRHAQQTCASRLVQETCMKYLTQVLVFHQFLAQVKRWMMVQKRLVLNEDYWDNNFITFHSISRSSVKAVNISWKNNWKLMKTETIKTGQPITLHGSCHVPDSFCAGIDRAMFYCMQETCTRLKCKFLYVTGASFLSVCHWHYEVAVTFGSVKTFW